MTGKSTSCDGERLAGLVERDLADVGVEWLRARRMLPRLRRSWHTRVLSEEDRQRLAETAKADHEGKWLNAARGLSAIGESPAPLNMHVAQQLDHVERSVVELTRWVRQAYRLAPLTSHGSMGVPCDQQAYFVRSLNWLKCSGLAGLNREDLNSVAGEVMRVLRILIGVTGRPQIAIPIHAACPSCQRLSLFADISSFQRDHWWVECLANDCGSTWVWNAWDELSDLLGIPVLEAAHVTSAAA